MTDQDREIHDSDRAGSGEPHLCRAGVVMSRGVVDQVTGQEDN